MPIPVSPSAARVRPNAVWTYDAPYAAVPSIKDHSAFDLIVVGEQLARPVARSILAASFRLSCLKTSRRSTRSRPLALSRGGISCEAASGRDAQRKAAGDHVRAARRARRFRGRDGGRPQCRAGLKGRAIAGPRAYEQIPTARRAKQASGRELPFRSRYPRHPLGRRRSVSRSQTSLAGYDRLPNVWVSLKTTSNLAVAKPAALERVMAGLIARVGEATPDRLVWASGPSRANSSIWPKASRRLAGTACRLASSAGTSEKT
jgi:hypothetical protein